MNAGTLDPGKVYFVSARIAKICSHCVEHKYRPNVKSLSERTVEWAMGSNSCPPG